MSAKKETLGGTIGIVVAVCLACSVVVSGAAVGLRSIQQVNAKLDEQSNILTAAGLIDKAQSKSDIQTVYDEFVEERFVDLATGEYVQASEVGPDYDMYKAAKVPELSTEVTDSPVGFSRRPDVATVYLVKSDGAKVDRIILPVHGSGLWDLMYGFLALDSDGNTIKELIYYNQKETPGLGGEIQNPAWQAKWNGKKLFNGGEVAISVEKGEHKGDPYTVDGLSGATLTSNGVKNTLQYWAGENGYGQFLKNQNWKS